MEIVNTKCNTMDKIMIGLKHIEDIHVSKFEIKSDLEFPKPVVISVITINSDDKGKTIIDVTVNKISLAEYDDFESFFKDIKKKYKFNNKHLAAIQGACEAIKSSIENVEDDIKKSLSILKPTAEA
jgi:hypothetical protein